MDADRTQSGYGAASAPGKSANRNQRQMGQRRPRYVAAVNVALWIAAIAAAAMSFYAAMNKMAVPKDKLVRQGVGTRWAEDFSAGQIRAIGAVEAVGALGLILPQATGIAEVLTPIAAVGLIVLQFGAIATHLRRREAIILPVNLVLVALLLFVAIGRFAGK